MIRLPENEIPPVLHLAVGGCENGKRGRYAARPEDVTCRTCKRRLELAAIEPRVVQAIRDGLLTRDLQARFREHRLSSTEIARIRARAGLSGVEARSFGVREISEAAARVLGKARAW